MTPPCGSAMSASRKPGVSNGGMSAAPPNPVVCSAVASTSPTAKLTLQCGGTSVPSVPATTAKSSPPSPPLSERHVADPLELPAEDAAVEDPRLLHIASVQRAHRPAAGLADALRGDPPSGLPQAKRDAGRVRHDAPVRAHTERPASCVPPAASAPASDYSTSRTATYVLQAAGELGGARPIPAPRCPVRRAVKYSPPSSVRIGRIKAPAEQRAVELARRPRVRLPCVHLAWRAGPVVVSLGHQ